MKTMRQLCLLGATILFAAHSAIGVPSIEANGPLLQYIQDIAGRDAPWNKDYNRKTREVVEFVEKMETAIRQTSEAMKRMGSLQTHAEALKAGVANGKDGGSFKEIGQEVDGDETNKDGTPVKELDIVKKYGDPSTMLKYERGVGADGVFRGAYARANANLKFERNYVMRIKSLGKVIEVPELMMQPPYWLPDKDGGTGPASWRLQDSKKLLIKTVAKYESALAQRKNIRAMERELNNIAQVLLPDELLQKFNPQNLSQRLLTKAGVVKITDRVTLRPSTSQDTVFSKYAGLASKESDAMLFWSDPMVVNGYHPLFGTTLNKTELKGTKMLDMDGVVSRGYSVLIDQYNRLQPSNQQVKNPFKGYAGKVVPGLVAMAQQGRIPIHTEPSDEQIEEALKLSKTLKILPSQNLPKQLIKKTAARSFHFNYPAHSILIEGDLGVGNMDKPSQEADKAPQGAVELGKLDKEVYIAEVKMIRRRLKEIDTAKKLNRKGYEYTNEILNGYIQMSKEADQVSKSMVGMQEVSPLSKIDKDGGIQKANRIMVPMASIPEITLLRKAIALGIERQRDALSDLQHEYDDLKQKEWVILENLNKTRKEAVEKLMYNAPVEYRTIIMKD